MKMIRCRRRERKKVNVYDLLQEELLGKMALLKIATEYSGDMSKPKCIMQLPLTDTGKTHGSTTSLLETTWATSGTRKVVVIYRA